MSEKIIHYNTHKDNCKECKHWGVCDHVFGCTKHYREGLSYLVAWPQIAWCEDWEKVKP